MTHAELVQVAARWLKRTVGCTVVLVEPPAMDRESPDAIGWRSGWSVLVECKTSRADFCADQKKPYRQQGRRLAHRCYYLTPPGLVAPDSVPHGWGLLETVGKVVRVVKELPRELRDVDDRTAADVRREVMLLWAELRRYHVQGITYQTITGRTAQGHLVLEPDEEDVREARRLMGLEARA